MMYLISKTNPFKNFMKTHSQFKKK